MKKSRRKAEDFRIETVYSPYKRRSDDTFDEIYRRYLEDENICFEKDGLTFYKAAKATKFTVRGEVSLSVALPWEILPERDCVIVDENGNQYEYRGCETMSFTEEIPEWYFQMVFAVLSFPDGDIGKFFAKKDKQNIQ